MTIESGGTLTSARGAVRGVWPKNLGFPPFCQGVRAVRAFFDKSLAFFISGVFTSAIVLNLKRDFYTYGIFISLTTLTTLTKIEKIRGKWCQGWKFSPDICQGCGV